MNVLAFTRDPDADAGVSKRLKPQIELLALALSVVRAEFARAYGERPSMVPPMRGPSGVLYPPIERSLHEALRDVAVLIEHARALPRR